MSDLTSEQTEQLIRALHDGADYTAATEMVLRRLGPQIRRFVLSKSRDWQAAEEAFSEFSHDLWRGMPNFRWECSVRVWSYRLARNALARCAKRARRRRLREVALSDHPSVALADHERADTNADALRHCPEPRGCLAELYRALPAEDQTLLHLRITQKRDWKEVAHMLNAGRSLDQAAVEQETARLRKRFQLVKARLRRIVSHKYSPFLSAQ